MTLRGSGQIFKLSLCLLKGIRIRVVVVDKMLMNLDLIFEFILDGEGHVKRNENNE